MAIGDYSEIDSLMEKQYANLEQQQTLQDSIVDTGLQKTQNEVDKLKQEYDEDATKQAKALYSDYKKQSNPYGANAEQLASTGLNNSGYAESSQVSLYNNYQKNVTEVLTNTAKLKADADFQMTQAYLDADIQKAQNSLALYQQQAELQLTEYQLRYQKYRDDVADEQWEKTYQMQLQQAQQSQANWEKEYQLSLQSSS